MYFQFNTCVTPGNFVRITRYSKPFIFMTKSTYKKGQNNEKYDLDLKKIASSCQCYHKQYNLKV